MMLKSGSSSEQRFNQTKAAVPRRICIAGIDAESLSTEQIHKSVVCFSTEFLCKHQMPMNDELRPT